MSLLTQLWSDRARFPFLSAGWAVAWAKRIVQGYQIFRQGWFHARLQSKGARIGQMCFFSAPHLISGDLDKVSVGDETFIGRAKISVHAALSIGSRVCINDDVTILTASHAVDSSDWETVAMAVMIEDYAWIATGSIILPGVKIGRGAVVGAGAVVTRDVDSYQVVVGNPARPVLRRRPDKLDYSPTAFLALFTAWRPLELKRSSASVL